jgi:ABC-type branched-subunit amino acid transport system permease subunit
MRVIGGTGTVLGPIKGTCLLVHDQNLIVIITKETRSNLGDVICSFIALPSATLTIVV